MEKNVYTRQEVLNLTGFSEESLCSWEAAKVIKPVGFTEDHVPFYSAESAAAIRHIQKLMESGYDLAQIQKIIKKVGLPQTAQQPEKTKGKPEFLTVGLLAERARVSPRTVKHWEDKGIIEPDMWSEGGFRLYSEVYIEVCRLIKDLQLFGYTLEEIKTLSDLFRDFLAIQKNPGLYSKKETLRRLEGMLHTSEEIGERMNLLSDGIKHWADLLKKKRKEIQTVKNKVSKHFEYDGESGDGHAA